MAKKIRFQKYWLILKSMCQIQLATTLILAKNNRTFGFQPYKSCIHQMEFLKLLALLLSSSKAYDLMYWVDSRLVGVGIETSLRLPLIWQDLKNILLLDLRF